MAKTSRFVPQKEKASSSSRPARSKTVVPPRIEECLRDAVAMQPPPPGEEEIPMPSKEKKRKRGSPTNPSKPKKRTDQKAKADTVALSSEMAQRLWDKDEEGDDDDCMLVVQKIGSTNALKSSETMVDDAVYSRTEEISEGSSIKVPEPSGSKRALRPGGHLEGETEGPGPEALQREENAPSGSLGVINEDDSPPGPEFFEGQLQDARNMRTLDLASIECRLQSVKGESLARSRKIEEHEAKSAVELAKAKSNAEAFISSYRADSEAAKTHAKEISAAAEVKLSCALDHAMRQSRRETLKEVHACGFDLSADIEKAKTLEEKAVALLSDDEDSPSGSESGGDENEFPEEEAPEDAALDDAAAENVAPE
ncbi:PREDICTED: uncharacterized protein LOC109226076 [Nicotiana attenuata]|uniref:uncharacterized protein LOC109226076 n=1 Tax=Nicotiana attenuata TaxID=49451 RepID=UPI000904FA6C|nr:PREDICTED: uncharacterized protein LOC109226076 [Nicotiana attenuata]